LDFVSRVSAPDIVVIVFAVMVGFVVVMAVVVVVVTVVVVTVVVSVACPKEHPMRKAEEEKAKGKLRKKTTTERRCSVLQIRLLNPDLESPNSSRMNAKADYEIAN